MKIKMKSNFSEKEITSLPFGGSNGKETLKINSHFFEKNGKPWFPIMGEFHYSRFRETDWQREIYKMKSGGIQVVASYVIWIHHEEVKGEWDFSGRRNLRKFVEECRDAGVYFFLRLGPWAHGEVRNGGFPDWLKESNHELRSDDPEYLAHVKNYFEKIYEELDGLFFKDGGPIIGLQVENEYGHAGGFNGAKGYRHMQTLKKMLIECGFDVPFYTATAWGGAVVVEDETLPVFGGYVDAPWSYSLEELPASDNFLFSSIMDDPLIASDFAQDGSEKMKLTIGKYPYLTAELGGGLQVTKKRRPLVSGKDTETLAMVKLASGANLLGYYMYHGGVNPDGKLSYLQESTETGSYTDVPISSYDFQAPLGAYGQINESYGRLRKFHQTIKELEDVLVSSESIFFDSNVDDAENTEDIRYCLRYNQKQHSGILFVNNYQRRRTMKEHTDIEFSLTINDREIDFPVMKFANEDIGIYPFNIALANHHLISTNASLLCEIKDVFVFYHPRPEEAVVKFADVEPKIILLTDEEANNTLKINEQLFLSDGYLWQEENQLVIASQKESVVLRELISEEKQEINFKGATAQVRAEVKDSNKEKATYNLHLDYQASDDLDDFYLEIDIVGDQGELYNLDGKLVTDWFTTGKKWQVSMKTYDYPTELTLVIYPTNEKTYYEVSLESGCFLEEAVITPLYLTRLALSE